jgi:hypothetical protein
VGRFAHFNKNGDNVSLVFDKGNNFKDSMIILDNISYYFVGSLKPYEAIKQAKNGRKIKAYRALKFKRNIILRLKSIRV